MTEKRIDVTVPGNGYILTNPKLSHLQYYHGADVDLKNIRVSLAKRMAEDESCRWLQTEPLTTVQRASRPSSQSKD